jgi:hypothetical protein
LASAAFRPSPNVVGWRPWPQPPQQQQRPANANLNRRPTQQQKEAEEEEEEEEAAFPSFPSSFFSSSPIFPFLL